MKTPSKISIALLTMVMLLCLSSCKEASPIYSFRQNRSNIDKIQICSYDHDGRDWKPLVNLSDEEADMILSEIESLEYHEFFPLDPILSYGDVIICITYLDGEVEIIGMYNIGWVSPEGEWNTTNYYFDLDAIRTIIKKYVNADVLSEVSEEF